MQDLRCGWRTLIGAPIVSMAAILSLALGIGANIAIFSVLDELVLRSLPVDDPVRLVLLDDEQRGRTEWSNPLWEQVRDRAPLFDGGFAVSSTRFNMALHGESEFVDGLWASGSMFDVLGVQAIIGRTLQPADDRPGGGPEGPVAVISHAFWQRRFGAAEDTIGRTLTIGRATFTIVGVTPPHFHGVEIGRSFDIAVPVGTVTLVEGAPSLRQPSISWLRIMVRLKPGQSAAAGTALLRALQPQIREATLPSDWHPGELPRYLQAPFRFEPAANGDSSLREAYRRPLVTLMVVVGLVPAHRLCQRRQPAPRAGGGTPPRAQSSYRTGRVAAAAAAAAAHRKPAALEHGRPSRSAARALGQPPARAPAVHGHRPGIPPLATRLADSWLHRRRCGRDGAALWNCARTA